MFSRLRPSFTFSRTLLIMIQQTAKDLNDDRESVIVPPASVISFLIPNIALALRVLVAFENVLVELIFANFLNVKDAISCKLPYTHQLI